MDSEQKAKVSLAIAILILAIVFGLVMFVVKYADPETSLFTPVPEPTSGAKYVAKVAAEAVDTKTVDVTGCKPEPVVAAFDAALSMTFVNNGPKDRIIWFSPEVNFVVPANDKIDKSFQSWQLPGVRHYMCDAIPKAGALFVRTTAK